MDASRLLAVKRGIPWRLPADIRHFRNYTAGRWILAGKNTYREMQGWFLPDHTPVMLTRSSHHGIRAAASVADALEMAKRSGAEELVCCGGGQTYEAALPLADKMVLTMIDKTYQPDDGAVYFPRWNNNAWHIISDDPLPRGADDEPQARVLVYERTA